MIGTWSSHRLRLLRELQLRGTIAAVASALNYSASTVSQQLAKLESEIGTPLLRADGRRVRLTPAGETVAAHAARVLALEEEARGALELTAPGPSTVRVAAMQTAAMALVPPALARIEAEHPHVRVEMVLLPPEQGLFELEAGSLDVVVAEQYVGRTRPHRPGLERTLLGRDPIDLVVAQDSAIRSLADARESAWVVEPEGTQARAWVLEQCRAAGFEPDVRFEAADLVAHVRLIASGRAVGFVPGLAFDGDDAPVRRISLPSAAHREVFLAFRSSSREVPAVTAVRGALAAAFADARHRDDEAADGAR
ncbi:LysR family transcriptional regulator [Microbacterium sp. MEC084]|uniref:LysR family transcriptional regulator n=1 Tax=Microbacterium sp. MEC084 TaxID=1963027 RepID=UPI00107066EB|nr:LysR family transcriptional regulator [Microbacterium sp. MEC084]MCD1268554.1 LysR family transcriptional regulator [Microbacterium sp. MEC084]